MVEMALKEMTEKNVVQLDDGWQIAHGSWTPNDRFPSDLARLTASLHEEGTRAHWWRIRLHSDDRNKEQ
jgi:alpha-galactosidase